MSGVAKSYRAEALRIREVMPRDVGQAPTWLRSTEHRILRGDDDVAPQRELCPPPMHQTFHNRVKGIGRPRMHRQASMRSSNVGVREVEPLSAENNARGNACAAPVTPAHTIEVSRVDLAHQLIFDECSRGWRNALSTRGR